MSPVKKITDEIKAITRKPELSIHWEQINGNHCEYFYSVTEIDLVCSGSNIAAIKDYAVMFIEDMERYRLEAFPEADETKLDNHYKVIKHLNALKIESMEDFIKFLRLDAVHELKVIENEELDEDAAETDV
jgi:hypothetical protein